MSPLVRTQHGFTFMEALLTLTLMGIVAVPLLMALTSTMPGGGIRVGQTALANAARSKMEEVIAMGFANLALSAPPGTPTALSDQVTIRGQAVPRTVIVDLADASLPPDRQVDADFKRIIVDVRGFQMYTYLFSGQ